MGSHLTTFETADTEAKFGSSLKLNCQIKLSLSKSNGPQKYDSTKKNRHRWYQHLRHRSFLH